jgi:small-conductance mechanosensitive channel
VAQADLDRLQDRVELRRTQIDTANQRLEVLRKLVDGLELERMGWEVRFAIFDSKDLVKLQEAEKRLDRFNARMKIAGKFYRQQSDLAADLAMEQYNRLLGCSPTQSDYGQIREWAATYQERHNLYQRVLKQTEKQERASLHWLETLEASRHDLPFTGRVRDLFTRFSTFGSRLWNFEIFIADDTIIVDGQTIKGQRSVTVGKIILALIILVGGYLACSLFSRLVKRILDRRFHVEEGMANLIRRWVKFFLVLALIITSMASVKIPLTIFAFLGGALAIGVGFGTQTILKNFISGILLLIERPLRVGDILEVEGTRGRVVSIGIRSSIICTADGIETLIPNSAFLESNVTNWTYSNRQVRFTIHVGAGYGSSPRRVTEILGNVAQEHGLVLKDPPAQVLLEDFGDSALMFSLNYWLEIKPKTDSRAIASDLRHMIERRFTEENISISFPQRDIHLETSKPLKVEVINTPRKEDNNPSI